MLFFQLPRRFWISGWNVLVLEWVCWHFPRWARGCARGTSRLERLKEILSAASASEGGVGDFPHLSSSVSAPVSVVTAYLLGSRCRRTARVSRSIQQGSGAWRRRSTRSLASHRQRGAEGEVHGHRAAGHVCDGVRRESGS